MSSNPAPKLPKIAADGAEICDVSGNIWRYDIHTNSWLNIGVIGDPPLVTESSSGLISPEIYSQLQYLRQQIASGVKFDLFKINPATQAYWYYFLSTNKTIRFTPESDHELRIEVDRALLGMLFSRYRCQGKKGLPGKQGRPGKDGIPGPPEVVFDVVSENNIAVVDAPVTITIETSISLRFLKEGLIDPAITILLTPEGIVESITVALTEDYTVDATNLIIEDGRITGTVQISDNWNDLGNWTYRVGQIGRKGPKGLPGKSFFEIVPTSFYDENVRATEAVVSLRQGGVRGDLYYFRTSLFTKNCVSKISLQKTCDTLRISDLTDLCFAAVKQTTEDCKDITRYCFSLPEIKTPVLSLPEWTPVEACWQQRYWSISQFDWVQLTNVGIEAMRWPAANQRISRDPIYPFLIDQPTPPGERCCQDDFFFCANINDELCGVLGHDGESPPVILPPKQPQLCCECDCPISLDIQDGYDFQEVGVTAEGVVYIGQDVAPELPACQFAVCTVDSQLHHYRFRVRIYDQDTLVGVTVSFKLEYDPICDEIRQQYDADNKTFVTPSFLKYCPSPKSEEECQLLWSVKSGVTTRIPLGFVPIAPQGPNYEQKAVGETISHSFIGSAGIVDFDILVNLLHDSCCLGYRIIACVDFVPLPSPSPGGSGTTTFLPPDGDPHYSPSPSPSPPGSPSPSPSASPSIIPSQTGEGGGPTTMALGEPSVLATQRLEWLFGEDV